MIKKICLTLVVAATIAMSVFGVVKNEELQQQPSQEAEQQPPMPMSPLY